MEPTPADTQTLRKPPIEPPMIEDPAPALPEELATDEPKEEPEVAAGDENSSDDLSDLLGEQPAERARSRAGRGTGCRASRRTCC